MRCFIAIDLPKEVKQELSELQQVLPILPETKFKLVESENLHLTLVFLGELTNSQVDQCKEILGQIKFGKFKATTSNLGVFPSENFIRVAWISLEPAQLLKQLHDKIFLELKKLNFRIDKRFGSHITLARIKFIEDKKKFIEKLKELEFKQGSFEVDSFALKKSTITKKGPIYEDIIRFNLG